MVCKSDLAMSIVSVSTLLRMDIDYSWSLTHGGGSTLVSVLPYHLSCTHAKTIVRHSFNGQSRAAECSFRNNAERNGPRRGSAAALAFFYCQRVQRGEHRVIECDVAVYGSTPAGVMATIQAACQGKKSVLLSFN